MYIIVQGTYVYHKAWPTREEAESWAHKQTIKPGSYHTVCLEMSSSYVDLDTANGFLSQMTIEGITKIKALEGAVDVLEAEIQDFQDELRLQASRIFAYCHIDGDLVTNVTAAGDYTYQCGTVQLSWHKDFGWALSGACLRQNIRWDQIRCLFSH